MQKPRQNFHTEERYYGVAQSEIQSLLNAQMTQGGSSTYAIDHHEFVRLGVASGYVWMLDEHELMNSIALKEDLAIRKIKVWSPFKSGTKIVNGAKIPHFIENLVYDVGSGSARGRAKLENA